MNKYIHRLTSRRADPSKQGWYQSKIKLKNARNFLSSIAKLMSDKSHWLLFFRSVTIPAAKKLNVSSAAFEKNETKGKISLETLKRAAEALDCELVYAIRPKSRKKFSQTIWEILVAASIDNPWVLNKPQRLKGASLASVARRKMNDSEFRRKQTWTERLTPTKEL